MHDAGDKFSEKAALFHYGARQRDERQGLSERSEPMDNGASSYRRFLDGDDDGFTQIVVDYYDGLALWLSSYVRDLDIAEELAQETFAKLVTKKPRFNGRSSFKSWLYSIGRNAALDYLRREKRLGTARFDECGMMASDEDIEQNYLSSERNAALYRAMLRLKPDYRHALWLFYFEGMSQCEIAKAMGRSVDSIKHIITRARDSLKSELEKENFEL